jgi:hypothetical protein
MCVPSQCRVCWRVYGYYGVEIGPDGQPDREQVQRIAPYIVVIQVALNGAAVN